MKPYLVMDVDGVFNPISDDAPDGYERRMYSGPERSGFAWVNPAHADWLAEVLPRVEAVWATSWRTEPSALAWMARQLGLPEDLPQIEVGRYGGTGFGYTAKFGPVTKFIGDRPTIWIDDVFGGKDYIWAEDRTASGIPTLLEDPRPYKGLDDIGMGRVLAWLAEQEFDGDTYEPDRENG
ncbi:hypothetical protein [Nonomuraea sp. SYSU D8015]|uniref:hypothetical protein n=1 Tax=Nonomuraea sp. SYSU D8015 TaxID=2593644 RepID=UPI001661312F|nr:hypothetical protein [Nonomuraea sp. SYSU D8015]